MLSAAAQNVFAREIEFDAPNIIADTEIPQWTNQEVTITLESVPAETVDKKITKNWEGLTDEASENFKSVFEVVIPARDYIISFERDSF